MKNGIIKQGDREIYQFGIEVGISNAVNVITTIAIGFVMQMPLESLIVLFCFMSMRAYSGGLHALSYLKCYIISVTIIILTLLTTQYVLRFSFFNGTIIACIIASVIIYILSPVVHENRPLDDDEYPIFRKRARVIVVVFLTVTIILFFFNVYNIAVTSSITIFFVGISVFMGYIRQIMINKRSA